MASKFSDLPDIDTAPDVYETEDVPSLPDSSIPAPEFDAPAPGISAVHITPARAAQAFRSARWAAQTDFSGALHGPRRAPPRLPSAPESKLAKVERLRAQLDVLAQEGDGDLQDLYQALARAERKASGSGRRVRTAKTDVKAESEAWTQRTRRLLDSVTQPAPGPSPTNKMPAPSLTSASEVQVSQVEAKMTQLERYLGSRSASLDGPGPGLAVGAGLIPALEKIEHQLALLAQPKHRDAVARRIKVLSTELDRVHEASRRTAPLGGSHSSAPAGGAAATGVPRGVLTGSVQATEGTAKPLMEEADGEKAAQVRRLWRVQGALEPILPIAPALLQRMRALAALHDQASDFSSRFMALKQEASHLAKAQKDTRSSLALVGDQVTAMTGNMDELASLDERLTYLSTQLGGIKATQPTGPVEETEVVQGEVVYE